jgi:hypothetical protein
LCIRVKKLGVTDTQRTDEESDAKGK